MIPQVVASEQGRAQTGGACSTGVVGLHLEDDLKQNGLERPAIEGESPVSRNDRGRVVS
jgi:hypothetical protein